MKNFVILFIIIFTFINTSFSQIYFGNDAENLFQGSQIVKIKEGNSLPEYIKFRTGSEIIFNKFESWLFKSFNFSDEIEIQYLNTEIDNLGFTHYRCKLKFNNIPIRNSMFIIHVKNNKVYVNYYRKIVNNVNKVI